MAEDTVMPPVHPGEILLEEFLTPLGVSQYQLAKAVHAWAMLAAGEQHPAGSSAFRPGLAAWARSQFWRHLNDLAGVPVR